jgi:hypothetical protein
LLDVTKLCLSLAENLLNLALCFPSVVAHELAGDFFDLAFRFSSLTIPLQQDGS